MPCNENAKINDYENIREFRHVINKKVYINNHVKMQNKKISLERYVRKQLESNDIVDVCPFNCKLKDLSVGKQAKEYHHLFSHSYNDK